jgi:hypothetical protein
VHFLHPYRLVCWPSPPGGGGRGCHYAGKSDPDAGEPKAKIAKIAKIVGGFSWCSKVFHVKLKKKILHVKATKREKIFASLSFSSFWSVKHLDQDSEPR